MRYSSAGRFGYVTAGALVLGWGLGAHSAFAADVWTDADEYGPGDTALIGGAGFAPNESITLQVLHLTEADPDSAGHEPFYATSDEFGDISAEWYVNPDDSLNATFLLTADDVAGNHAEYTFRDANQGKGRLQSVVAVDSGLVSYGPPTPNLGNLSAFKPVLSWNVQQSKTYTATLDNVTDCGNGGTDSSIYVLVKNSESGNQLVTATRVSTGVYQFDVTFPDTSCNTFPIQYCTNANGDANVGMLARRWWDSTSTTSGNQSHFRAWDFDSATQDTDCSAPPPPPVEDCALTIACPADVSQDNDPGLCSASNISLGTPTTTASSTCSNVVVSSDAVPTYDVGGHTVTWSVTADGPNGQSAEATCTQSVTVNDVEDPIITVPGDITLQHDEGSCSAVGSFTVTSSDNCSATTSCVYESGSIFGVGVTGNTCTATDPSGNSASGSFNITVLADIRGHKTYDADVDGLASASEAGINGWKVVLSGDANDIDYTANDGSSNGAYRFDVLPGSYTVSEVMANSSWLATTATSGNVVLTAESCTATVDFGNVCLGAGGGHTLGYWSNKNGQATMNDGGSMSSEFAMLSSLNLVKADGSAFDPTAYNSFRSWLLNATAVNMSYMLSAQLAAMSLNVEAGWTSSSSIVYAPGCGNVGVGSNFTSISDLTSAANSALGTDGYTPDGDANRSSWECLKNALDRGNNNLNFVQPAACTFAAY